MTSTYRYFKYRIVDTRNISPLDWVLNKKLKQCWSRIQPISTKVTIASHLREKLEITKGYPRSCKFKQDRKYNGQSKQNANKLKIEQHEHHWKRGLGWTQVLRKGGQFLLQYWSRQLNRIKPSNAKKTSTYGVRSSVLGHP